MAVEIWARIPETTQIRCLYEVAKMLALRMDMRASREILSLNVIVKMRRLPMDLRYDASSKY